MKTAIFAGGFAMCLLAGLVIAGQGDATAEQASAQATADSHSDNDSLRELVTDQAQSDDVSTCRSDADSLNLDSSKAEPLAKKCSFNSDCSHGKCKKSACGGCSFNSDCNGWGKCGKGQCGTCSFDSECKGFGKCNKGKCTKSPYKK